MSLWFAIPAAAAGVALLTLLWRIVPRSSRLLVDDRGIRQRRLARGWIPWDEIEGAYPPTANESDSLRVRLRVTERLQRILPRRRKARLGDSVEVRLDLSDSEMSPVELLQLILAHQNTDPGTR